MRIRCFSLVVVSAALVDARPSLAEVATFENFTEGQTFVSFTDPVSGLSFENSTSGFHDFVIDFGGPNASRPRTSPGNILTADFFGSSQGIGLSSNFGFHSTLPAPTSLLDLDLIYTTGTSGTPTVTLNGFDSNSVLLTSVTIHPPTGSFVETHMQLSFGSESIAQFSTTASSIFTAYDNIDAHVPEPATLGLLGSVMILLPRRRGR